MSESTWLSPANTPGPPTGRPASGRRRRLTLWGSMLIVLGVAGAGVSGVLAWRAVVSTSERFTAPGTIEMSCDGGSRWRIGPQTGSSRSVGPVTVSTSGTATLPIEAVRVTAGDGTPIAVTPVDATETFSLNGAEYEAYYTFRCSADGIVTVTVDDVGGGTTDVAVFAAFGDMMRSLLSIAPLGIAAIAALVGGLIALAVRPRAHASLR